MCSRYVQPIETRGDDDDPGEADQRQGEVLAPLEIRVLPVDGRGDGSAQTLRRHHGPHPAPTHSTRHGDFLMARQPPQSGSRCHGPREFPVPPLGRFLASAPAQRLTHSSDLPNCQRAHRERTPNEIFPWDHIHGGPRATTSTPNTATSSSKSKYPPHSLRAESLPSSTSSPPRRRERSALHWATASAPSARRDLRPRAHRINSICPVCRYRLREHTTNRCPDCGTPLAPHPAGGLTRASTP